MYGRCKLLDRCLLLLWPNGMDAVGELLRLLVIRQFALHPQQVGVRRIGYGSIDGAVASALVAIEALARSGRVPVPMDIHAGKTFGDGSGFGIALAFDGGQVFRDEPLLVDVYAGVDHVDDGFVEELQSGLVDPLVFDCLQFVAGLADLFRGYHEIVQGLQGWVCHAQDECVVSVVDGGGDEGCSF